LTALFSGDHQSVFSKPTPKKVVQSKQASKS